MRQEALVGDARESVKSIFLTRKTYRRKDIISINGVNLSKQMLRASLAICPSCVREGHLEHMHSYTFCDICPKHSEYYHENCPKCGRKFEAHEIERYKCVCGFALANLDSEPAGIYSTQLVIRAIEQSDSVYLENLWTALRCTRLYGQIIPAHDLLLDCQNIATGDRNYFFGFIRKVQSILPHLHRRAILAPWAVAHKSTFRIYALEYLLAAAQVKPDIHPHNCKCSTLFYRQEELKFLLGVDLIPSHLNLEKIHRKNSGNLYFSNDYCSVINENSNIEWEDEETYPYPSDAHRLLTAKEAANTLKTTTRTIHYLHNLGFFKGSRFNSREGLLISVRQLESFISHYVLNSQIALNIGVAPQSLCQILTNMGAQRVSPPTLRPELWIYKRETVPDSFLNTFKPGTTKKTTPSKWIPLTVVAERLKLDQKDIPALLGLGILEVAPYVRVSGELGKERCTRASLRIAQTWRKRFLNFSEVVKHTGCSAKLLHMRFIAGGFAKEIRLNVTSLMTKRDANKIKNHYSTYTTLTTARAEYGLAQDTLKKLIREKKVHPLPSTHKHYLKGQVTILRTELDHLLRGTKLI
ncbi:hypothetical protein [Pseudomonas sp. AU12215]|uniref:hypothetical protein n=1 Tax=Pseudomonas sp. AU12215 TaxID=1860123 RepID=UPI00114630B1|nr:hypothetical protein [Pseudomonas sp. AU12215]